MKTILHRYLAANFILPFTVSTIFFVTFLLTFQMFRLTDLIVSKGLSLAYTLELFGHIAISFLPMAIPLSSLFSTVYIFNKLSNDSEYIAMRSFGMKKYQIFMPFLLVAILIAIVTYSMNQTLIPYSQKAFKLALANMRSTSLLADIKSGQFFTSIPNVTMFSEEVDESGKNLKNVFINFKTGGVQKTIYAKNGELQQIVNPQTKIETIRLVLNNGNIVNNYQNGRLEKILFEKYNFPIGDKSLGTSVSTKANMMSGKELSDFINQYKNSIDRNHPDYDDFMRIKLEYWTRYNTPLQCIVFILIGFVLGVTDVRGGKGGKAGKNLIVLLLYYIMFFGLVSQARKGKIPTQLAIFLPTLMLTFFGINQYKKLDWTS